MASHSDSKTPTRRKRNNKKNKSSDNPEAKEAWVVRIYAEHVDDIVTGALVRNVLRNSTIALFKSKESAIQYANTELVRLFKAQTDRKYREYVASKSIKTKTEYGTVEAYMAKLPEVKPLLPEKLAVWMKEEPRQMADRLESLDIEHRLYLHVELDQLTLYS